MSSELLYRQSKLDKIMTREQFDLIIEAILAGKYSWACVLILRFGGHNPLDYIPYRTFNRLIKENCKGCKPSKHRNRGEDEMECGGENNDSKVTSIADKKAKYTQNKQVSSDRKNQQDALAI
ncbi:HetP family heterocyst commitment protein [Hydrocoleum sp. CS-953]|uniref:HetP family heterocyst commitment protein n=1 Tax=Hydrocoleum sp. CS-953 TaxID=1671698 RepID=UPI00143D917F|nr:HetP family heterocyst commitment protein [Hydrocoleum sp. CS-953]